MTLIEKRQNFRKALAAKIWETRQFAREKGMEMVFVKSIFTTRLRECPKKPTKAALLREALQNYSYSRSRWNNPYDSEYYSACGYDDYQGDMRDQARKHAKECYEMYRLLGGKWRDRRLAKL